MAEERRAVHYFWPLLLAAALAVASPAQGTAARAQRAPTARSSMIWMIGLRSLNRLRAVPDSQTVVRKFFAAGRHSILVGGLHSRFPLLSARRSQAFASYRSLRQGLTAGAASNAGLRVVVLDLEHWPQTPRVEQRSPAKYYRRAARFARRRGLILVATPSANLVPAGKASLLPAFSSYLLSGLIGQVAKSVDIFEVQAQGVERSTALYREFVAAAAGQARAANPRVVVIAGLSTNPGGRGVPAAQLYRDAVAARPYVDGFWLNIPARSLACRRCGVARPDIAARFLRRLMRHRTFLPGAPASTGTLRSQD